MRKRNRKS